MCTACMGRWRTVTDFAGWQLQNSLNDKFADAVIQAFATTEVNLSFNGLGDDECQHLARVKFENVETFPPTRTVS